jgi:hypothetical protein
MKADDPRGFSFFKVATDCVSHFARQLGQRIRFGKNRHPERTRGKPTFGRFLNDKD